MAGDKIMIQIPVPRFSLLIRMLWEAQIIGAKINHSFAGIYAINSVRKKVVRFP